MYDHIFCVVVFAGFMTVVSVVFAGFMAVVSVVFAGYMAVVSVVFIVVDDVSLCFCCCHLNVVNFSFIYKCAVSIMFLSNCKKKRKKRIHPTVFVEP